MTPDARPQTKCLIFAGDHYELELTAVDENGVPINLTGCSVVLQVHRWTGRAYEATALVSKSTEASNIALTNPSAGVMSVDFTDVETEALSDGLYYLVTRITTAFGRKGTLEPFLARLVQTPLS